MDRPKDEAATDEKAKKRLVPRLKLPSVLDGLDDLLTRTYGKNIRRRAPRLYGPVDE